MTEEQTSCYSITKSQEDPGTAAIIRQGECPDCGTVCDLVEVCPVCIEPATYYYKCPNCGNPEGVTYPIPRNNIGGRKMKLSDNEKFILSSLIDFSVKHLSEFEQTVKGFSSEEIDNILDKLSGRLNCLPLKSLSPTKLCQTLSKKYSLEENHIIEIYNRNQGNIEAIEVEINHFKFYKNQTEFIPTTSI